MPYHEPDPTDPSMLVGTAVGSSRAEIEEMAAAFAAELAQLGHAPGAILTLFRAPSYAGPHLAWRTLGEARIGELVGEAARFWSHCRVRVEEPCGPPAPAAPRLLQIASRRA